MGASRQLSFTLTNHSTSDPVRFTWSPPPEITFSPCVGHLQPNCAKDVTVTFCSKEPKTYSGTNVPCKVTKIKLGEAQDKVSFLGSLFQIKNLFRSWQTAPSCVWKEGCWYVYSVNLFLGFFRFFHIVTTFFVSEWGKPTLLFTFKPTPSCPSFKLLDFYDFE